MKTEAPCWHLPSPIKVLNKDHYYGFLYIGWTQTWVLLFEIVTMPKPQILFNNKSQSIKQGLKTGFSQNAKYDLNSQISHVKMGNKRYILKSYLIKWNTYGLLICFTPSWNKLFTSLHMEIVGDLGMLLKYIWIVNSVLNVDIK